MVKNLVFVLFSVLLCAPAISGPCDKYKKNPDVNIKKAEWKINVHQTDENLGQKAGYVNVQPFNSFAPKIGYVFNGEYYCVYLDSVESTIGFRDFEIYVDKKFPVDSCEYNAVLAHENHHINDAIAALNNVFPRVKQALQDAANDVQPVYVTDADSVPQVFEKMSNQVQNNKKLMDLVNEFKTQNDRDAAALDSEPDDGLEKCIQEKIQAGIDKVHAAFDKYFKNKK